ncbi:DUF1254 domain-containing protein [Microbulbifer taiwanensis]|uniref:DUF1254 domain-containing protein n=1 Tax=Microbulbifer taiwanensis TaxID=986746 RepID=A0ABW1YQE3_9GAMM
MKNEHKAFTSKDTVIVTPNSDIPNSFAKLNLYAEPIVLTALRMEMGRYN